MMVGKIVCLDLLIMDGVEQLKWWPSLLGFSVEDCFYCLQTLRSKIKMILPQNVDLNYSSLIMNNQKGLTSDKHSWTVNNMKSNSESNGDVVIRHVSWNTYLVVCI